MVIVSVLTAIAAQSMLESQTRAKVARVNTDMRDLARAVEAYFVDHGIYPPSTSGSPQRRGFPERVNGIFVSGTVWVDISTPVAYIGNAFLLDVFNVENFHVVPEEVLFTYQNLANNYCGTLLFGEPRWSSSFCDDVIDFYGAWRIGSVGPDMDYGFRAGISAQIPYDPTNGIVSLGNIWRSQLRPDNDMPSGFN